MGRAHCFEKATGQRPLPSTDYTITSRPSGITWHGWHGFRRGLASNLNRLGVDDSVIQRILLHSKVATTQNHYIKTASPDAIAAMKQFSQALMCSLVLQTETPRFGALCSS
jgi:integrase